jgi:D-alanyl-D-alanine carboxypeptidase/D-alanyl-D-alanine-endopeptidase (penicillin-binding protein 4)
MKLAHLKMFALVLAAIIWLPTLSFAKPTTQNVTQRINHLLNTFPEDLNIGIVVQDMQNGNLLYSRNANRLFMPASNMKLLTAIAALSYLGPNYTFPTQLLTDAPWHTSIPVKTSLTGNLHLKFSGDPNLDFNQLEALLAKLKAAGISTIKGNLYLDTSTYDQAELGPGWMWDDLNYAFAAPISAFMLEHNRIKFNLLPAHQVGMLSKILPVEQSSAFKFVHINNQVVTVNNNYTCEIRIESDKQNNYTLSGCIKANQPPICVELAIRNLKLYARAALEYLLNKQHLKLQGVISYGTCPVTAMIIAQHSSNPLAMLTTEMLKDSDNLIAGTLFKTLGAHYYQQKGTWQNGSSASQAILQQQLTDINWNRISIKDGSGMSSYNLVTPQLLGDVLYTAYQQPQLRDYLWNALAIAGVDGTLKHRMLNTLGHNNVRAKTGTMASVSALSGYLTTRSQHTLAFVILINGFSAAPEAYQQLEDRLCEQLINL